MDVATIAVWRDWAAILLAIEAFLLLLPFGIALYVGARGLGQVRGKLAPIFDTVQMRIAQVERITKLVSRAVVTPPVLVLSVLHGLRGGLRALVRR